MNIYIIFFKKIDLIKLQLLVIFYLIYFLFLNQKIKDFW